MAQWLIKKMGDRWIICRQCGETVTDCESECRVVGLSGRNTEEVKGVRISRGNTHRNEKLHVQANRRMEKVAYEELHTLLFPEHIVWGAQLRRIRSKVMRRRRQGKKIGNRVT